MGCLTSHEIDASQGRRLCERSRAREVGLRHSSCEAGEQGGANRCGAGGAKGGGQGECVPAKHVPGTGPGKRVTGAGAHTAGRSSGLALRTRGKSRMHQRARTDLRGGRGVIPVPTATIIGTAWFFDSMDLGALTFVLGSIKQRFQLSTAEVGLLSSLSFLGMFVGAASAGLFADRFGRARVFQTSMIFWGLGSLACGLSSTVTMLGASRLLLGFGMGHGVSGRAIH